MKADLLASHELCPPAHRLRVWLCWSARRQLEAGKPVRPDAAQDEPDVLRIEVGVVEPQLERLHTKPGEPLAPQLGRRKLVVFDRPETGVEHDDHRPAIGHRVVSRVGHIRLDHVRQQAVSPDLTRHRRRAQGDRREQEGDLLFVRRGQVGVHRPADRVLLVAVRVPVPVRGEERQSPAGGLANVGIHHALLGHIVEAKYGLTVGEILTDAPGIAARRVLPHSAPGVPLAEQIPCSDRLKVVVPTPSSEVPRPDLVGLVAGRRCRNNRGAEGEFAWRLEQLRHPIWVGQVDGVGVQAVRLSIVPDCRDLPAEAVRAAGVACLVHVRPNDGRDDFTR